jgi:hypothetical protein
MHVGLASLGFLPATGPVLRTLLAAVDMVTAAGIAFATWGLRVMDPRLGIPAALCCASFWFVLTTVLLVGLAALLGLPLV